MIANTRTFHHIRWHATTQRRFRRLDALVMVLRHYKAMESASLVSWPLESNERELLVQH